MTGNDQRRSEAGAGRLGLALSGGGFRAAFFHIGVLARLAELDLLRQVEVISTVSGGSVVGAMYYLKLRRLLMETPDAGIGPERYVTLVAELEREFHDGVRMNLRMRTFASVRRNLKMFDAAYSRSDSIAELYSRHFFTRCLEPGSPPRIPLRGTIIQPMGEPDGFKPFGDSGRGPTPNDRRVNKVPVLLLNATSLNTGHNFRFTATWMGEVPPRGRKKDIDQNTRLRRIYLDGRDKLPEVKYETFPLDVAVAASTSVPGVFPPLALTGLYADWTPQLVDGGVYDNQGIEGLLDPEYPCAHLIVSDACGQMQDEREPSPRSAAVFLRSNTAMMDRIREEEYGAARQDEQTGAVEKLWFLHLREGLKPEEITWTGGAVRPGSSTAPSTTSYGVDAGTQILLSRVRTDLDSFTEVEAAALMADGYLIARGELERMPVRAAGAWGFRRVEPYLADPNEDPRFQEQIAVAGQTALKVFRLIKWLGLAGIALSIAAAGALLAWFILGLGPRPIAAIEWIHRHVASYRALGYTLLTLILYGCLHLFPREIRWIVRARSLPQRWIAKLLSATVVLAIVWTHLLIFDRLFLRQGQVSRLRRRGAEPAIPRSRPETGARSPGT
ncbi:MAG TPA: patatin-like phospholipase family protein [Candidatus Polarisedimenticolia bacterium]|jgi:NTE family protein